MPHVLNRNGRFLLVLAIGATSLLASLTGCADLDWSRAKLWEERKPDPQCPTKIVDLWTDTVLHQAGETSIRGFGGRIMFYGEDEKETCVVAGKLTVLAFDDDQESTKPEKVFVFLPEQLDRHYSKSEIGHSYSFWIPWDAVGGPARRLTLVTRFEDAHGTIVTGKPVHKQLPGERPATEPATAAAAQPASQPAAPSSGVLLASHSAPVEASATAPPAKPEPAGDGTCRVRSFTIDLAAPQAARWLRADAEEEPGSAAGSTETEPAPAGDASEAASSGTNKQTGQSPSTPLPASSAQDDGQAGSTATAPAQTNGAQTGGAKTTGAQTVEAKTGATTVAPAAPPARLGRGPLPAQTAGESLPRSARVRKQPLPGRWLYNLPATPRYDWARASAKPSSDAAPSAN